MERAPFLDGYGLFVDQAARRMKDAERVVPGWNVIELKTTVPFGDLEKGMIEDKNPSAHSSMKDAAQPDGLGQSSSLVKDLHIVVSFGHGDVERRWPIVGHHVVQ